MHLCVLGTRPSPQVWPFRLWFPLSKSRELSLSLGSFLLTLLRHTPWCHPSYRPSSPAGNQHLAGSAQGPLTHSWRPPFGSKGSIASMNTNTRGPKVLSHFLPTLPLELESKAIASPHLASVSSGGNKKRREKGLRLFPTEPGINTAY